MCAVAGDLHLSVRVFAALAAVRFLVRHGTPASRMHAFLLLNVSHDVYSVKRELSAPTRVAPASAAEHKQHQKNNQYGHHFSSLLSG
jgi:hypothetical protein